MPARDDRTRDSNLSGSSDEAAFTAPDERTSDYCDRGLKSRLTATSEKAATIYSHGR
jgi:hypothetical protein